MTPLSRRAVIAGLCSNSILGLSGCVTNADGTVGDGTVSRLAPGYKPSRATDEGGLWQVMEKAEDAYKQSRQVIRDPRVNAYVKGICCRLADNYCPDIRVYVVRNPYFNASMAPNGMMVVWSGLFLRAQNEAQLAAILGHEMGHYIERHMLQRWRDARDKAGFAQFLTLGLGPVGLIPALGLMASIYSFSRDQEREADNIGLELMAKAGYDPREVSHIWAQMIEEDKADKNHKDHSVFFTDHPQNDERMKTMQAKAEAMSGSATEVDAERYWETVGGIRTMLLQDELRLRQLDRSLVVFEAMRHAAGDDGELAYYTGEVYRLRAAVDDEKKAAENFERAQEFANCPPDVYRSIGLMEMQSGHRDAAETAFNKYLTLQPQANDREMLTTYLRSLSSS